MNKKKLLLVNPTLSNPFPGFPPLGLGYVAALTPDDWDVEIVDENFEIAELRECDLVGLTGFTAMANRAYQVARMFKVRGVPVVMGGIHASMMPDEALRFVDAVVIGEAESVWGEVIADFEAGRLKHRYQGVHTDLKGLVHPRRDLFHKDYYCDTIQTARGCPNDCNFCSVSQFNGFAYRRRPVEEVLEEIATLNRAILFFVDDNIVGYGANGEKRAIELARGMVARKFRRFWYGQAALNVSDNPEVLKAFSDSGCGMLFLGFESENHDVLKGMNKRINLARDYHEVIQKIHDHHIGIHGSFIFGTDDDTMEMLRRRFDFIREAHIDVLQHCTLTPYPGTRLFDRMREEGRLFYSDFPSDWDRYDLTEVMVKPRNLEVEEYTELMREISADIFDPKNVKKRFMRTWKDTGNFLTAFWCMVANRLYQPPGEASGRSKNKFWYLSPDSWPFNMIMKPEMETHRRRYLRQRG